MSTPMIEVKYRCQHPSCVVNCREGVLGIAEALFTDLKSVYTEDDLFRSPRGVCRLGFNQAFKIIKLEKGDEKSFAEAKQASPVEDPIGILVEEHKVILGLVEKVEQQIRKRDIDALWISTCELENALMLHSGHKEEDVLVPVLKDLMPFVEGLVAIIKEDHREVLSLLHNFRGALAEGDILDGIIISMVVSLRGHIRKEDYEFFELVDKCLTDEHRVTLVEGMKAIEKSYVPVEPGIRPKKVKKNLQRENFNEQVLAVKDLMNSDNGCSC